MPLSKAEKMKNEEIFTSVFKNDNYLCLPQINLRLLVLNNKLQVSQEDIIKLKKFLLINGLKKILI